jgi:hypothetical protein
MPTPLSLSDAEYDAVMQAAAPIAPAQRDAFLRNMADELARHEAIGPGLVHRLCAELQSRFAVPARAEASAGQTARHSA